MKSRRWKRSCFSKLGILSLFFISYANAVRTERVLVPRSVDNQFLDYLQASNPKDPPALDNGTWKASYYRDAYRIALADENLMAKKSPFNPFGALCLNFLDFKPEIRASVWARFIMALAIAETNLTKAGQKSTGSKRNDHGILQMSKKLCSSTEDRAQIRCALREFSERASSVAPDNSAKPRQLVYGDASDDSLNWSVLRQGIAKVPDGTVFGKLGTKFIPLFKKFIPECELNDSRFDMPKDNEKSQREFDAIDEFLYVDKLPGTNFQLQQLITDGIPRKELPAGKAAHALEI